MGKPMGVVLLLFCVGLLPCYGQKKIRIDIDSNWDRQADQVTPEASYREISDTGDDFLIWAWDIPDDYYADYPISKSSHWMQAKGPLGGGVRALHLRDQDNGDDFHLSGYFFFRPLLMNFSRANSVSLGAFVSFDGFWGEQKVSLDALNIDRIVRKRGIPFVAGFSMLWECRDNGLQMVFEAGYVWIRTRFRIRDVTLQVPFPPFFLNNAHIRRIQSEESINVYWNLSWTRNATFLDGFSLEFFSTNRVSTVEITAKAIHSGLPFGAVDLPKNSALMHPTRTNFALGVGWLRLLSIPGNWFGISEDYKIDIEPMGFVGYFATAYGNTVGTGVRVRIFGALGFNYVHSWEQKNNDPESDIFAVELGFQLGRSSASRTQ